MKYASIIVSIALAGAVLVIVATLEATERSKERAACYRTQQNIEACPKPAAWERWLAWLA